MTKAEIIASILDQARDKDALANGEADSIFADDARALREAAELLKSVPEWVSVADRLPNDDATRLVWIGGLRSYAVADYYGDGEWIDRDYCNLTRDVTHWMPLPDAPEEDEEDE